MVNKGKGKVDESGPSQGSKRSRGGKHTATKKGATTRSGKQPVVPIPRASSQRPRPTFYGAGLAEEWYKEFPVADGYVHERPVNKVALKKNFREIYKQIVGMGWSAVFDNPGPVNIDLVLELYSNIILGRSEGGEPHHSVLLRGEWVPLTASTLCAHLGVPDHPVGPLLEFIKRPDYKAIRETLCGPDSMAKWARYREDPRKHKTMLMGDFLKEARVWLRLLNYRIMPLDHFTTVLKERVAIVYFFLTGQPVNLGYWMLQDMTRIREGKSLKLSFGNTLTAYLRKLVPHLESRHDRVLDCPDNQIDISNVQGPEQSKFNLTPAQERSAQSTVLTQLYKMALLASEQFELDISSVFAECPHTTYSRVLIGEEGRLPADEDLFSADRIDAEMEEGSEEESEARDAEDDEEADAEPSGGEAEDDEEDD